MKSTGFVSVILATYAPCFGLCSVCIPYKTYKYSTGELFKRKEITREFCQFLLASRNQKNQIGGFVKSMYSKMLMLSLTLIMTACNSGSGSGDKPKLNPAGACIPEANLEGIVGGEKVGQYDYDANKVVMLLSESSDGVELCTAAPIAPDVLLTAAHCITASASNTKAFATTSATCESGFDRLSQGIVAEAVVVNENYVGVENSSLSSVKSDVALVFLKSSLPNYYPVYRIADSQKQISSELYLYGYGAVSMKKRSSGILRKTEVQEGLFEIDHSVQEVRIDQT